MAALSNGLRKVLNRPGMSGILHLPKSCPSSCFILCSDPFLAYKESKSGTTLPPFPLTINCWQCKGEKGSREIRWSCLDGSSSRSGICTRSLCLWHLFLGPPYHFYKQTGWLLNILELPECSTQPAEQKQGRGRGAEERRVGGSKTMMLSLPILACPAGFFNGMYEHAVSKLFRRNGQLGKGSGGKGKVGMHACWHMCKGDPKDESEN